MKELPEQGLAIELYISIMGKLKYAYSNGF